MSNHSFLFYLLVDEISLSSTLSFVLQLEKYKREEKVLKKNPRVYICVLILSCLLWYRSTGKMKSNPSQLTLVQNVSFSL